MGLVMRVCSPGMMEWMDPSQEGPGNDKAGETGLVLSEARRAKVKGLFTEYAECFALSVKGVHPVKGAVHRLDIHERAEFSTNTNTNSCSDKDTFTPSSKRRQ